MTSIPRLRALQDDYLPSTIEIDPDGTTFGRDETNDVLLPGQRYPHISTFHARVFMNHGELVITDLGSKNGTYVNNRRVQRATLRVGDLLQLGGKVGPRFAVIRSEPSQSTIGLLVRDTELEGEAANKSPAPLSSVAAPGTVLVAPRRRRPRVAAAILLLVVGAGLGVGVWWGVDRLRSHAGAEGSPTEEKLLALERRIHESELALQDQQKNWSQRQAKLEAERDGLRDQLYELERAGRAASPEGSRVRRDLALTTGELARYQPLDPAAEEFERLMRAVVLLEVEIRFRDKASEKWLHVESGDTADGTQSGVNLEGRGDLLVHVRTGSGFCVSADGWVITSAHVVTSDELLRDLPVVRGELEADVRVQATFSGQAERHLVKVFRRAQVASLDLAVVRVEPYSGMPFISDFQPDAVLPVVGAEVRLIGFPLGTQVPHRGDEVLASVFQGIVSRVVSPYLQIDAGVHPGNSGGPLVDAGGRVIGVVTGVQTVRTGDQLPGLGYALPIGAIRDLWPPAEIGRD